MLKLLQTHRQAGKMHENGWGWNGILKQKS